MSPKMEDRQAQAVRMGRSIAFHMVHEHQEVRELLRQLNAEIAQALQLAPWITKAEAEDATKVRCQRLGGIMVSCHMILKEYIVLLNQMCRAHEVPPAFVFPFHTQGGLDLIHAVPGVALTSELISQGIAEN